MGSCTRRGWFPPQNKVSRSQKGEGALLSLGLFGHGLRQPLRLPKSFKIAGVDRGPQHGRRKTAAPSPNNHQSILPTWRLFTSLRLRSYRASCPASLRRPFSMPPDSRPCIQASSHILYFQPSHSQFLQQYNSMFQGLLKGCGSQY